MRKILKKIIKPLRLAYLRCAMRTTEDEIFHLRELREYSVMAEHHQRRRQLALAEQHSQVEAW